MRYDTPLREHHEHWAAAFGARARGPEDGASRPGAASGRHVGSAVEWLTYGPPDEAGLVQCEIPATFGSVELEYAALRRGAGLMDAPHRATLRATGGGRIAFLERMLTQKLVDMTPGSVRESFWLNRKGRIEADLVLVETGDAMLISVDVHRAAATLESLNDFIFAEDIELADVTDAYAQLGVHGPEAGARLTAVGAAAPAPGGAVDAIIGGHAVVIAALAQVGAPGFVVFAPRDGAVDVWTALLDAPGEGPVRPVGWYAFNIARLEAGLPIFNVDFGTTNLPHESGLLAARVSFDKGCYLGQEVVARLHNLGRPKQVVCALLGSGNGLPVAGSNVFARADGAIGDPLGTVTSSAPSPMLGARPIALAQLRNKNVEPGVTVLVETEDGLAPADIVERPFWSADAPVEAAP